MSSCLSDLQGRGRSTYISDWELKASECADLSVKIAGNEGLDYCISAGHCQIIEAEWDRQDPSKVCRRKMDWGVGIAKVALTEGYRFSPPAVLMMQI